MENTLNNGLVVKLNLDNFVATIIRSNDAKGDILIPEIIEHESNKFTVNQIESFAFSQNTSLIGVSIPPTVKIIGESAFYKCDQLKTLTFVSDSEKESSIEEIGNFAFDGCVNLDTISPIPLNVRRIGNSSFSNCQNLKSIELESSKQGNFCMLEEIGDSSFYNCTSLETIFSMPSSVRRIGETAFYKCSKLKNISFFSSDGSNEISNLKEICKFAFADCTSLESITKIPSSIVQIGESAFRQCSKLKSLNFSSFASDLEEIGNEAFYNCSSLEDVTFFPSHVRKIGNHAFCKCSNLKSFSFGPECSSMSLEEIGEYAFCDCLSIEKVISIPVTLRKIGGSAFYKCGKLKLLTFGSNLGERLLSLEEIGDASFYGCSNLELVAMIPSTVRRIGESAFYQCQNLKLIVFDPKDSQLEEIGRNAFYECANLLSVTMIPSSVRIIGKGAFYRCSMLKTITFASAIQSGAEPPALVEIGKKAFFECATLEAITCIPATVRKVGKSAFSGCLNLSSLTFTGNDGESKIPMLEEISDFCFSQCKSLENLFVIPASVIRIGKSAFYQCEKLKSIKFQSESDEMPNSAPLLVYSNSLDEIADDAFFGCTALEFVSDVPETLRKIGEKAFFNCGNMKIFNFSLSDEASRPALLNEIGSEAFSNCANLESFKTTSKMPLIIGHSCFANDILLGAVVCHGEKITICGGCFNGCALLAFAYFPNAKEVSIADEAFDGIPESFEIFVPNEVNLNGSGLEKVKKGIRSNEQPQQQQNIDVPKKEK